MDQDQTASLGSVWSGIILFVPMKKSSLKCIWKYAAFLTIFQLCGILIWIDSGEPVQPSLSLKTPNDDQ